MLNGFASAKKLKQALDAGVSAQMSKALVVVESRPIDEQQQALLDEAKNLSDGLRETVLDKRTPKQRSDKDKKNSQFLQDVIEKALHAEKQQNSGPGLFESSHGDERQAEYIENKSKKDLGGFSTKKNQNVKIQPVEKMVDNDTKKSLDAVKKQNENRLRQSFLNSVEEASHKLQESSKQDKTSARGEINHQVKEKNDLNVKNDLEEQFPSKKTLVKKETQTAQLKKLVVEKSQLSKILQRQGDLDKFEKQVKLEEPNRLAGNPKKVSALLPGKQKPVKKPFSRFFPIDNLVEAQADAEVGSKEKEKKLNSAKKKLIDNKTAINKTAKHEKNVMLKDLVNKSSLDQINNDGEYQQQAEQNTRTKKRREQLDEVQPKAFPSQKNLNRDSVVNRQLDAAVQNIETTSDAEQRRSSAITHTSETQSEVSVNTTAQPANTIPDELKTAVQWMAEEEVENKLVELLSRQARLRGIDLS